MGKGGSLSLKVFCTFLKVNIFAVIIEQESGIFEFTIEANDKFFEKLDLNETLGHERSSKIRDFSGVRYRYKNRTKISCFYQNFTW